MRRQPRTTPFATTAPLVRRTAPAIALAAALCALTPRVPRAQGAQETFETTQPFLRDGDRVALLGNTLVERMQVHAYLETIIALQRPAETITFRNLGWSGDNVFGHSRTGFDPPETGFARILEHVRAVEPTVVITGYGGNEAFAGAAGLPDFRAGLDRLLDALAEITPRLVLLSPIRQEGLVHDPTAQNERLALYSAALREEAGERGLLFIDLFDGLDASARPLTDNGIHLSAAGYLRASLLIARELGYDPRDEWVIDVAAGTVRGSAGEEGRVEHAAEGFTFELHPRRLPLPVVEEAAAKRNPGGPDTGRRLRIVSLPDGTYRVVLDGDEVARASAAEFARGITLARDPARERTEALRRTAVRKNFFYFHRYRPANWPYLFGFRKHEQGNNAVEIPGFDPLALSEEERAARLRVPEPHRVVIQPAEPLE